MKAAPLPQGLREGRQGASFRDPSGFVFVEKGLLYRKVSASYQKDFDQAVRSGLYQDLIRQNFLIPHEEVSPKTPETYKLLMPEPIAFLSYPYEWCFSQLKDAALLTLTIQKKSLEKGMSLKDATPFNIQFQKGKPIWIDTLSFEIYQEGNPWTPYRQFCESFLAPLALMSFCDLRMNQMLLNFSSGIPLDLASSLLPFRTRLSGLVLHLHLQAKTLHRDFQERDQKTLGKMNRAALLRVLDHLENCISGLKPRSQKTLWGNYQEAASYSPQGLDSKKRKLFRIFSARFRPDKFGI